MTERAGGVLRERVASAARAITDRFVYRSYRCFIVYSPAAGPPAADRVGDIVFRLATPSDLERLDALKQYGRGSTHRRYVEKDQDWLFLACHADRIVATRRGTRVIRDGVISRVIQLRPDQFWGADVFCVPEYRGRGIARYLQAFGDRYLATLGYKHRLGTVNVTNAASLSMNRATGTRPLYYVQYRKVLGWETLRVTKDIPAALWGGEISAGREAPPRT